MISILSSIFLRCRILLSGTISTPFSPQDLAGLSNDLVQSVSALHCNTAAPVDNSIKMALAFTNS